MLGPKKNKVPTLYANKKNIGMVIGFVNQTSETEIGKFALKKIAKDAANNICIGTGIHAKNNPIEKALDMVYLLKYHLLVISIK